ncbi:MAG: tetratricopeptide repeat protein [Candidatus Omnitrophota bacterium]
MWKDLLRKKDKLKYPTQYVLLGQSYLLKGKHDKAIAAYHKAIRMKPDSPKAQLFLANAWFRKGVNCSDPADKNRSKWLHKAMIHYDKAKELSPNSIVGEWARRQLKEAHNSLKTGRYIEILKEVHEKKS